MIGLKKLYRKIFSKKTPLDTLLKNSFREAKQRSEVSDLSTLGNYVDLSAIGGLLFDEFGKAYLKVTRAIQHDEYPGKGFWKFVTDSKSIRKALKSLKTPPGVVADTEASMKERYDSYMTMMVYPHTLVIGTILGLALPIYPYLVAFPVIISNVIFSVFWNAVWSSIRVPIHIYRFKKVARKKGVTLVSIKELIRETTKTCWVLRKRYSNFKRFGKYSRKVLQGRELTKREKKKYVKHFKKGFLEDIENEKTKTRMTRLYYTIERKQARMMKEKPGKYEGTFKKSVTQQKLGGQRPLLVEEFEFANLYAEALGFDKLAEERSFTTSLGEKVKKEVDLTPWYALRKKYKELLEQYQKGENLELVLNERLLWDMLVQVFTLVPAAGYMGFDLLEGAKGQQPNEAVRTFGKLFVYNWLLSFVGAYTLHKSLLKLSWAGVNWVTLDVPSDMIDIAKKRYRFMRMGL